MHDRIGDIIKNPQRNMFVNKTVLFANPLLAQVELE